MCGIIYVKRFDSKAASKTVLKRYSKQRSRGSDGFGYIAVKQSGNVTDNHRYQFEHEVRNALDASKASSILFHHRYPTSTPNVPEAAHPIKVSHAELQHDYYVVHNGVLSNEEELKEAHEKLGYKYTTELSTQYRTRKGHVYNFGAIFNDSEALAIELARTIEGKQKAIASKGAAAFIAMQVTKQGQAIALYYGTNGGNPLTIQRHKDYIVIASEGGEAINDNSVYRLDLRSYETTLAEHILLEHVYTPRRIGFETTYKGTLSSGYEPQRPSKDLYKFAPSDYADMSVEELETELETLDDEIIGAAADREYSLNTGEEEEADMWQDDYQRLLEERHRINSILERKILERESGATKH